MCGIISVMLTPHTLFCDICNAQIWENTCSVLFIFYQKYVLSYYIYQILHVWYHESGHDVYYIYIVRTNEWRTYLCCTHNITRHLILGCLKHVIITYGDILLKANDINMTYCMYCMYVALYCWCHSDNASVLLYFTVLSDQFKWS